MGAAFHPITYGGIAWSTNSEDPVYLELREGYYESAETSGTDEQPVGGTGMWPRNHPARSRRIVLVGHIRGIGSTDLAKAQFYEFHQELMRAAFEEGVTKVLGLTTRAGTAMQINARTEVREFEKYVGWVCSVTIGQISTDPHWAAV